MWLEETQFDWRWILRSDGVMQMPLMRTPLFLIQRFCCRLNMCFGSLSAVISSSPTKKFIISSLWSLEYIGDCTDSLWRIVTSTSASPRLDSPSDAIETVQYWGFPLSCSPVWDFGLVYSAASKIVQINAACWGPVSCLQRPEITAGQTLASWASSDSVPKAPTVAYFRIIRRWEHFEI